VGERWLDIFTDIDEDNRLARGRRYANNGNVDYVNIERNIVKVSVYGSGFRPYRVKVKFKPLKVAEKKQLRKIIENSPSILASLAHGKLPSSLLENLIFLHNIT